MNTAVGAISVFAVLAVGCGATGAGSGAAGAPGEAGSASDGISLSQSMGWVDGASNSLGIQGAVFSFADELTKQSLSSDFSQPGKACIKGTAAKVNELCAPPKGYSDCFSYYFGAAVGENLNQTLDPAGSPMPFDASGLRGFSFDIDGAAVPTRGASRFYVETADTEYKTPLSVGLAKGANTVLFTGLYENIYFAPSGRTADSAASGLVRIVWQVVTNDTIEVPFDFCVSNVVALPK